MYLPYFLHLATLEQESSILATSRKSIPTASLSRRWAGSSSTRGKIMIHLLAPQPVVNIERWGWAEISPHLAMNNSQCVFCISEITLQLISWPRALLYQQAWGIAWPGSCQILDMYRITLLAGRRSEKPIHRWNLSRCTNVRPPGVGLYPFIVDHVMTFPRKRTFVIIPWQCGTMAHNPLDFHAM